MDTVLHQAGAIVYRVRDAQLEVLLITSRGTRRWIIPKGNIDPGLTPAEAAEREAYEEAGVHGATESTLPLGFYTYFKKSASGALCPATVEVYLLNVDEQFKRWPEKRERRLSGGGAAPSKVCRAERQLGWLRRCTRGRRTQRRPPLGFVSASLRGRSGIRGEGTPAGSIDTNCQGVCKS